MKSITRVMVAVLGMASGWAVAGNGLSLPTPAKVSDVAKSSALGAANAALSKPCSGGKPTDGKATGAICNEVAGQLASSLANQTAPSAKNVGAIAKVAAVGMAGDTLSKPCVAGTTAGGTVASAACKEVAGQLATSLANQTAPSAKNLGAMTKAMVTNTASASLSKPCAAGTTSYGKTGSAICSEVAGQLAASLANQTAPSAENVVAIAKVAAAGMAGDTLSKPCVASTTAGGTLASAACKEVAGQLAASLGSQTAPKTKNITAGVQGVVSSALAASAGQKISQALGGSQQPLVGDLLTLGLKRQLPAGSNGIGTFAPPSNSALPIGTEGLRSGLSILSTDQGKAGLGVKTNLEVGSKKFEISGSLDPNSSSDQGKSAGVQIKIGGD